MDKILAATTHFKYKCKTCQMELNLGSIAHISKEHFIFDDVSELSVDNMPYGILWGMYFSHKMKAHCYKCGAKLGYSNYGLSPLNKDKRAYKLRIKALDVIANHTEVTASTESSSRTRGLEKGRADEARSSAQPFNERTLRFLRRRENVKAEEDHDIVPPYIEYF